MKNTKIQLVPKFPKSLLSESPAARVAYFRDQVVIEHPAMTRAFDDALRCIRSNSGPRIIIVTGPTGVGKTTMAARLAREIRRDHAAEMKAQTDFIPALYGSAIPPSGTKFDWKDFYVRLLHRAGDVLIERKVAWPSHPSLFPEFQPAAVLEGQAPAPLRRAVESCLKYRRTRAAIIDDAQHILMLGNREVQFENIKSLSTETNTSFVLIGTYGLLDIRDHSAQLVRRSKIVHFGHYDRRLPADQQAFVNALAQLQTQLPLARMPNLLGNGAYFYRKTFGCVGILKDWLTRSLELALATQKGVLDNEVLEACALSNNEVRTITREILDGEAKLADMSDEDIDFYQWHRITREEKVQSDEPTTRATPPKQGTSTRRIGQRNPVRDSIGA